LGAVGAKAKEVTTRRIQDLKQVGEKVDTGAATVDEADDLR
jgi:hypothetical protein